MSLSFGSLFSGIGGFDLGLERAGFEIAWQIENDPFCNKVLAKHWPGVKRYGDIKQVRGEELEAVDLIAGGPPCQPASVAGKRKGTEDNRWLWPETLRIVREVKPTWCLFENPTGILSLQGGLPFEHVLLALEDEGYEVSTFVIPACAIGAPHRRDRIWIVAHSRCFRQKKHEEQTAGIEQQENRQIQQSGNGVEPGIIAHSKEQHSRSGFCETGQEQNGIEPANNNRTDSHSNRLNGNDGGHGSSEVPQFQEAGIFRSPWQEHWYEAATRLCGVDDGIFRGMDRHRTKRLNTLGNAVVPGIVEIFGRMIIEVEYTS